MKISDLLKSIAAEIDDAELSPVEQRQYTARIKAEIARLRLSRPFSSAGPIPDIDLLKRRYIYDPATGKIFLRLASGGCREIGEKHRTGYVRLDIKTASQRYRVAAHRVAWTMHHGAPPPNDMMIDHIDGNRANNAISNLRLATPKQNAHVLIGLSPRRSLAA
ncbi:HNH endonuclease signature motif containing protein [Brevundimonas sp.]|uniref:HNH endonuclease signature motif containing protein n=1 Tax=Brevundimonas sp. TaxID=1871086 RepID=UPI0039182288